VNRAPTGDILALVTHAREVPAVERERFAERVRREVGDRALVLETCHRVEVYAMGMNDGERMALGEIQPVGGRILVGESAIRHAITVAVGSDSVVLGEDQILHQLRASVDRARNAGSLDPALERLFAHALQAGRRARSWHQGPQRSLADVALSAIERQRGPLRGCDILIVGAGRMGRLAARAAVTAGASVSVANRSAEGARTLAAVTGARIEPFDPGARIGAYAAAVVALGGPWPISAATADALIDGTTIVVDLSVPSAVPAGVAEMLGPRVITADTLALAEFEPGTRQKGSAARFDALIGQATAQFVAWMNGGDGRAAAKALVMRADREREAELAALWRRLPDLEPEAREAIEGMTRHLADRLLRGPLERLGRDGDGRDERAIRDIFAL
jgi:glutamyl-tRNA reductase